MDKKQLEVETFMQLKDLQEKKLLRFLYNNYMYQIQYKNDTKIVFSFMNIFDMLFDSVNDLLRLAVLHDGCLLSEVSSKIKFINNLNEIDSTDKILSHIIFDGYEFVFTLDNMNYEVRFTKKNTKAKEKRIIEDLYLDVQYKLRKRFDTYVEIHELYCDKSLVVTNSIFWLITKYCIKDKQSFMDLFDRINIKE